MKEMLESIFI